MYTRTIRRAILALSAAFTLTTSANAASAQNYHHKIAVDQNVKTMLDSTEVLHLQVNLQKMTNEKFRLSAFNPASRFMVITIQKGDDVFYIQNVRKDLFDYVFDLSSLEDGNYQLMIYNGKEKISKNILIQTATRVDREMSVN